MFPARAPSSQQLESHTNCQTTSKPAAMAALHTSGLTVQPRWLSQILDGSKTLEVRSANTKVRQYLALIGSGTSAIQGAVLSLVRRVRQKSH